MADIQIPPPPDMRRVVTGIEPADPVGFSRRGFMCALASIPPAWSWPAIPADAPADERDRALTFGGENVIFGDMVLGF